MPAPNNKIYIWQWHPNSRGAKKLQKVLNGKIIRSEGSTFMGKKELTVLNWGGTLLPDELLKCQIVNAPKAVSLASDKLKFFSLMKDNASIPEFTTDLNTALGWEEEGKPVVGRQFVSSSGGRGIVFINDFNNFSACKLFTQYKKKKAEFRIHVFNREIILEQKKSLRKVDDYGNVIDPDTVDFRIQNLANGFIFKRNDVSVPEDVRTQAMNTFRILEKEGLTFGAFDIIYNEHEGRAYILECNTAPGLEGTTINDYGSAISKFTGCSFSPLSVEESTPSPNTDNTNNKINLNDNF